MQPTELNADLADADLSYFSAAQTSLRQTGIVVFRNLFNWIASLLDIVRKHAEQIVVSATTRVPLAFPPHFRWVAQTYACDLTALDPNTAGGNDEFCDTSLYRAIMTKLIERLLRAEITENGGYTLIRTRTILPKAEVTGALTLHMEKTAIRFPGVHVIWTPLTPPSIATNRDASGIEFCLRNDSIYRPLLSVGDIVVFAGDVMHGTYIPPDAKHWRVGCDIRLFPWTAENLLPPEAIAMGHGPRPLHWRAAEI